MSRTDAEQLTQQAEKLLPKLDNHASVVGCPEKRSLAYQAAELIRAFVALSTTPASASSERAVAERCAAIALTAPFQWTLQNYNDGAKNAREAIARDIRAYAATLPAAAPQPASAATTTDAIIKEYRGGSQRGLAIALADHARFLESDITRWKRLYECAQNANSFRQDAIDAIDAERGKP